jgi:hypothetical protein
VGSLAENVNQRDAAALASLRESDPVIAALIDANPGFDTTSSFPGTSCSAKRSSAPTSWTTFPVRPR